MQHTSNKHVGNWRLYNYIEHYNEHRNHICRKTTTESVITEHRLSLNHDFDWENVTILSKENFWEKRLISEMLHIKRQSNSSNLQSDTEHLHHAYVSILNKL